MLKIRPMKINSMRDIQKLPDTLNKIIEDHYQLMSLHISPEDLLHMTAVTKEEYTPLSETTVNVSVFHTRKENRENHIKVVNHLVNRILFYGTDQFTYQDEVYVAAVLKKLGIENITYFMKQAEQIKKADEKKIQLMELYWKNGRELYQMAESKKDRLSAGESSLPEQSLFLQNLVYQRLKTAELYSQIYEQIVNPAVQKSLCRQELFLTELAEHSDSIVLSEVKRQLGFLDWQQPEQYNPYEIAEQLSHDYTKEKILSRMAGAVLMNLTEKTYYSRLEPLQKGKISWLDISQAIYKSAETTLKRLEFFYQQPGKIQEGSVQLEKQIMKYDRELEDISSFSQIITANNPLELEQKVSYESGLEELYEGLETWVREKGGRPPEKKEQPAFLKNWVNKKVVRAQEERAEVETVLRLFLKAKELTGKKLDKMERTGSLQSLEKMQEEAFQTESSGKRSYKTEKPEYGSTERIRIGHQESGRLELEYRNTEGSKKRSPESGRTEYGSRENAERDTARLSNQSAVLEMKPDSFGQEKNISDKQQSDKPGEQNSSSDFEKKLLQTEKQIRREEEKQIFQFLLQKREALEEVFDRIRTAEYKQANSVLQIKEMESKAEKKQTDSVLPEKETEGGNKKLPELLELSRKEAESFSGKAMWQEQQADIEEAESTQLIRAAELVLESSEEDGGSVTGRELPSEAVKKQRDFIEPESLEKRERYQALRQEYQEEKAEQETAQKMLKQEPFLEQTRQAETGIKTHEQFFGIFQEAAKTAGFVTAEQAEHETNTAFPEIEAELRQEYAEDQDLVFREPMKQKEEIPLEKEIRYEKKTPLEKESLYEKETPFERENLYEKEIPLEKEIPAEEWTALKRQLDLIDQKNKETFQKLKHMEDSYSRKKNVLPDKEKIKRAALMALENKEVTIEDTGEAGQLPEKRGQQELENKLSLADQETKELYGQFLYPDSKSWQETRNMEKTRLQESALELHNEGQQGRTEAAESLTTKRIFSNFELGSSKEENSERTQYYSQQKEKKSSNTEEQEESRKIEVPTYGERESNKIENREEREKAEILFYGEQESNYPEEKEKRAETEFPTYRKRESIRPENREEREKAEVIFYGEQESNYPEEKEKRTETEVPTYGEQESNKTENREEREKAEVIFYGGRESNHPEEKEKRTETEVPAYGEQESNKTENREEREKAEIIFYGGQESNYPEEKEKRTETEVPTYGEQESNKTENREEREKAEVIFYGGRESNHPEEKEKRTETEVPAYGEQESNKTENREEREKAEVIFYGGRESNHPEEKEKRTETEIPTYRERESNKTENGEEREKAEIIFCGEQESNYLEKRIEGEKTEVILYGGQESNYLEEKEKRTETEIPTYGEREGNKTENREEREKAEILFYGKPENGYPEEEKRKKAEAPIYGERESNKTENREEGEKAEIIFYGEQESNHPEKRKEREKAEVNFYREQESNYREEEEKRKETEVPIYREQESNKIENREEREKAEIIFCGEQENGYLEEENRKETEVPTYGKQESTLPENLKERKAAKELKEPAESLTEEMDQKNTGWQQTGFLSEPANKITQEEENQPEPVEMVTAGEELPVIKEELESKTGGETVSKGLKVPEKKAAALFLEEFEKAAAKKQTSLEEWNITEKAAEPDSLQLWQKAVADPEEEKKKEYMQLFQAETVFSDWSLKQRIKEAERISPVRQNIPLALVYKENGQEQTEALIQQSRENIKIKNEITKHVLQKEEIATVQVNEIKKELWNQSKKEITELLRQNLQVQVNGIADKVYSRLEKRLQNEKKRRGF